MSAECETAAPLCLEVTHLPNGGVELHGEFESHVATPLWRAMMRVEAEFLVADAEGISPEQPPTRTDPQRQSDAFVELVRRIGEAMAE